MNELFNKSKLFLKNNSSTILTCIGAVGVVATAVTAAKATPKAMSLLRKAEDDKDEELTRFEKITIAGPAYIPTIAIGISTIACIFGANVLNKRQQAILTSAYALLDNSYKEYKDKVKEIYGIEGHNRVTEWIVKDRLELAEMPEYRKKQKFFDFYSLMQFESTIEEIEKAEELVNSILQARGSVSLAEFYEAIGISCGDMDYQLGWSRSAGCIHGYDQIEFIIEKLVEDDNSLTYVLTMPHEPTEDYMQ